MNQKHVGFVGVGRWAEKLRKAFVDEGWSVVCHTRRNPNSAGSSHWGFKCSIEYMVAMDDLDLIVCAADPVTTTHAAFLGVENCRPVLATKPLLRHPTHIAAPFVVDLWRLVSQPWASLVKIVSREEIIHVEVHMSGAGPYRDFPGVFDYGPHAMAFLYHLGIVFDIRTFDAVALESPKGELIGVSGKGTRGGKKCSIELVIGNGGTEGVREVLVDTPEGQHRFLEPQGGSLIYERPGGEKFVSSQERSLRFLARKLAEYSEGNTNEFLDEASNITINYSSRATRDLTILRAKAELPPYEPGDYRSPRSDS